MLGFWAHRPTLADNQAFHVHAKNIAVMAGAKGEQIDQVADQMIKEKKIKLDRAKEILEEIR